MGCVENHFLHIFLFRIQFDAPKYSCGKKTLICILKIYKIAIYVAQKFFKILRHNFVAHTFVDLNLVLTTLGLIYLILRLRLTSSFTFLRTSFFRCPPFLRTVWLGIGAAYTDIVNIIFLRRTK
jgi:hypothetical protein